MQYYSKTPKQLREDLQEEKFRKKKKRRWGRIILFVDIVLVILILIYVIDYQREKDNTKNKSDLVKTQEAMVFYKDAFAVKTHCGGEWGCVAELKPEKKGKENPPPDWKKWQWQISDQDDKQILLESNSLISWQNGIFTDNFKINLQENQSNKIYAKILDGHDRVIIRFRVYPR